MNIYAETSLRIDFNNGTKITLTDQIHWWRQDGSFDGELYIRICELKKQPYNK